MTVDDAALPDLVQTAEPGGPDERTTPDEAAVAAEPPAATATDVWTAPAGVRELEALLFVAERPLSRREIGQLCGLDRASVDSLLGDLEVALRDRGVRLATSGDQVELATAPEAGPLIGRYVGGEGARVTPAAMEALAIVAYRQPVTRGVLERIRGVDFGLCHPEPAASPPHRRAGACRHPGPAHPLRDQLRVHGALRPDLAR